MAKKTPMPRRRRQRKPVAPPDPPRTADEPEGRAKLFWNGRSQAVRLPKEFRFEGDEVHVRRDGDKVILAPLHRRRWPRRYFERLRRRAPLFADFETPEPLPPGGTTVDLDRP